MNKTTLNFAPILTEPNISSIATKYGFIDKLTIEKFIMDYEMHHHITDAVDCITRGGMCMPFHTPNNDTKRLSQDIDLITSQSVSTIEKIMENIPNTITEVTCKKVNAIDPYPLDNLTSYRVFFDSCLGGQKFIKVDFFCDVNHSLNTITIPAGYSLFAFDTDKDMEILSKGALLGDKITTLGLGTIGLKPTRQTEIAKQVYDIGVLIRSLSLADIESALNTFQTLTQIKTDHFDRTPKYTLLDIIENIDVSVTGFINLQSAISVTAEHEKRFNNFKGTYLSTTTRYKKTEHVTDVLLVKIFVQHLRQVLNGNPIEDVAKSFFHILDEFNKIDAIKSPDRFRASLIGSFPGTLSFKKNILDSAKLEHVLLLKKIYNL